MGPACPQEYVGNYVKMTSMLDVSASRVLHTCIPAKEISGTGIPILDWMEIGNPGKKDNFANMVSI